MNPDLWQEIERLYNKALELAPGERTSFLEKACAGDEVVRREVDALLTSRSGIDLFMAGPAMEVVARALAQDQDRVEATLAAGQTIAHYRVVGEIGHGGMGVVYRAEDTKLKRTVALKCLPQAFAADPERLARFEREAWILASLNHHNIAAIHGLEEAAGQSLIVLEFVEGETLAQRIAKGPLPVQEALDVCRQIAEALEAAHEKGIIHRDLKPANIKITPEGKVKVLDFGLAKAFHGESAAADVSQSPTLTDQMTRAGVILGTAAYMSPEQAVGKPVDKRADVWAFGCILYECLAGKRAFPGETVTETLAAIPKAEPDWNSLPADVPETMLTVLRRCLQKEPVHRLRDIGDARLEISEPVPQVPNATAVHRYPFLPWVIAGAALLLAGVLIGVGMMKYSRPASAIPIPLVASILLEDGYLLEGMPFTQLERRRPSRTALAISHDGRFIAYGAIKEISESGVQSQLYLRPKGQSRAIPVAGTDSGIIPFFALINSFTSQAGPPPVNRYISNFRNIS